MYGGRSGLILTLHGSGTISLSEWGKVNRVDVVGFLVAAFEIPVVALDCGYAAVPVVGRCGNRIQPLPCAANDGLAAFFAGDGNGVGLGGGDLGISDY